MREASPRPWKWDTNADGFLGVLMIVTERGTPIASLGDMEEIDGHDIANADLIVEAVNTYPALVTAIRAAISGAGLRLVAGRGVFYEVQQDHIDALAALLPPAAPGGEGEM